MNERKFLEKVVPIRDGGSDTCSDVVHNENSLPMESSFVEERKTLARERYGAAWKTIMRIKAIKKMVQGLQSLIGEKKRGDERGSLQEYQEHVSRLMTAIEAIEKRAKERGGIARRMKLLESLLQAERDVNSRNRHMREQNYLQKIAQLRAQFFTYSDVDDAVEHIASESEAHKNVIEKSLQESVGDSTTEEHHGKLHPRFFARYGDVSVERIKQYTETVEELNEYIKQLQEYGADDAMEQKLEEFLLRARQRLALAIKLHEEEIAIRNAIIAGDDQVSNEQRDQLRGKLRLYDSLESEIESYFSLLR